MDSWKRVPTPEPIDVNGGSRRMATDVEAIAPVPPTDALAFPSIGARSDRRYAYAMTAATYLPVVLLALFFVLGWRLASIDAKLAHAQDRIELLSEQKSAAEQSAARFAGEVNSLRETLRAERQRNSELERLASGAPQLRVAGR